ncbi:hypothetical protein ACFFMP_10770 [Pseudoroseomonas cervicalis]|uniref:hypothetical protein n=1 Tax=Teichococcus cervicalis TaxID=204525 RepID=UPI0035E5B9DD
MLDDADCVAEEAALFHLINACAAQLPLLLAGRQPPARWPVALPDLASRLRATAAVGIAEPSDRLLATLLARQFAERQLRVPEAVQDWLLARLPREAGAIAAAAARLDRAALAAGGAVTRALARAAWPISRASSRSMTFPWKLARPPPLHPALLWGGGHGRREPRRRRRRSRNPRPRGGACHPVAGPRPWPWPRP